MLDYMLGQISGPEIYANKFNSIFKTEPVNVEVFAREFQDREYSKPQLDLLFKIFGKNPEELSTEFNTFTAAVGQGGGKNFVFEGAVSYLSYFICNLIDPFAYLSKLAGNPKEMDRSRNIDIGNSTLVNKDQAERAFFESMKNAMIMTKDPKTGDNWFERYAGLDIDKTFENPEVEYYKKNKKKEIRGQIIHFPPMKRGEGSLRLISFDSTATSPEGYQFILGLCDEFSRAETKSKYNTAKKILAMYQGNNLSRFGRLGKTIGFSYLNTSTFDLTNDLVKKYEEDQKAGKTTKSFAVRYTTWDFNPQRKYEEFAEHFESDTADIVDASARYKCIKIAGSNQFFYPHVDKINTLFTPEIFSPVTYSPTITTVSDGNGGLAQYTAIQLDTVRGDNRARAWAFDPSINQDSFIIVGGYSEPIDLFKEEMFLTGHRRDAEIVTFNRKPIIDTIIVWKPSKQYPVDFINVSDIIQELIKKFPGTYAMSSDRYQNEKLRMEIERKGVFAKGLGFGRMEQYKLYMKLRIYVWRALMKSVFHPTLKKEFDELMKDGTKIDHPDGGSKDIADAVAICTELLAQHDLYAQTTGDSINFANEAALRGMVNQFITVRHNLRKAGINDNDPNQIEMIRQEMSLEISAAKVLKNFVTTNYPRS